MAPEAVAHPLPVRSKAHTAHPYAPLSAEEIINASSLLRSQWPQGTDIQFKAVTLAEPPKLDVLPYLDAERNAIALPSVERKAFICYYLRNTNKLHEAIVSLTEQKVESNVRLGKNLHGAGDAEEIMAMERIVLEDDGVREALKKLSLPEGAVVVCDPWIYGTSLPFHAWGSSSNSSTQVLTASMTTSACIRPSSIFAAWTTAMCQTVTIMRFRYHYHLSFQRRR